MGAKIEIKRKHLLEIILFLIIAIIGVIYVGYTYVRFKNEQADSVIQIARSIVATFPKEDLKSLEAKPGDTAKPEYKVVKSILKSIISVNTRARFAYIYTGKNGKIYFIADSEPESSKDYSPPGQEYTEAKSEDKQPFLDGKELITPPLTDRWGHWRSVLIPIKDEATGKIIAIFGMDFNAKTWNSILLFEVIESSALILLLLLAFLFSFKIKINNKLLKDDISKRRHVEEVLRQSEEKYRVIFDYSPVGILSFDDKGIIVACNENFAIIIGNAREKLIGLDMLKLPDNKLVETVQNTLSGTTMIYEDIYHSVTVEKATPVRALFTPIDLGDGHIIGGVGIIEDITQRRQAEGELEESREKYRGLSEASFESIFISEKGRCIEQNLAAEKMFGYTSEEALLRYGTEWIIPEDREMVMNQMLTGYEGAYEATALRKDGTTFPCVLSGKMMHYKGRDVRVTSLSDITYRKLAEESLQKSEEKFRKLIESSHDIIYTLTADGVFTFVSPAWTALLGHPVNQVAGRLFQTFVHPDDLPECMVWLQKVIDTGKRQEGIEYRVRHIDGSWYWHTSSAVPLFDKAGMIFGFEGTARDITYRKLAEDELKQISARLSLATRAGGVGVWDLDIVKNILLWDDQMFALYGITQNDFSGAYEAWQAGLHPDDSVQGDAEIKMALSGEKEFDTEFRVVWQDGSIHNIKALATVQRDDSGKAVRMIGTNWDITERKRSQAFENELMQLSLQLTGIPGTEISSALDIALSRIGSFLAADRAYLFELNLHGNTMSNTHEWCNEGIPPEIGNLQEIPYDILPMWMETLQRHENIIIPSVRELPATWQAEREILEPQGIQSLLVIPVLNENRLIGFVGLDSVVKKREYSVSEINILQVWGNMLGGLINNQRIEVFLDQTRRNYETFFNTIDDFLFVLDEQGNIIHTNTTVINRLKYSRQELLGKSVLMVHPPDRRDEAGRIVGEMLSGSADFCPVPIITKSGVQIPVETRVKQGVWDDKPAIFGVTKDISRIQLSEEKFSKVFYLNPSACGLSDLITGKYIEVNEAFYTLLGFEKDEVIGRTASDLNILSDETISKILLKADKNGNVINAEADLRAKNGDIKHVQLSSENICVQDTTFRFTVVNDVTESKQARDEVVLLNAELEQRVKQRTFQLENANKELEAFSYSVAHNLRSPLRGMDGWSMVILENYNHLMDEQGRAYLVRVRSEAQRMGGLIDDLLKLSRVALVEMQPVNIDLTALVQTIINRLTKTYTNRQFEFSVEPGLFVSADPSMLEIALTNLLDNAFKFTGQVDLARIEFGKSEFDGKPAFFIRDNGAGFNKAHTKNLFVAFHRMHKPSEFPGSGIGLATVQRIISRHSGRIWAESHPGEGASFYFTIN
ncbi:MAG: PAS domain S-box protein [Bacteroidales bacterium]